MTNKTKKLAYGAAALAVTAACVAPALEASATVATATFADDKDTITVVHKIANAYGVVNPSYTYTVTADATNPAGATSVPTGCTATFNENLATPADIQATCDIDFGDTVFALPGDYTYTVNETSSTVATYPADTATSYKVFISVRNNAALNGYTAAFSAGEAEGDKATTITGNTSELTYTAAAAYTKIEINSEVSGNLADTDKCFEYTVTGLSGTYHLNNESTCQTNGATSISNGESVFLKHGETAVIGAYNDGTNDYLELPIGTEYTITQVTTDATYTTTVDSLAEGVKTVTKTAVATDDGTYAANNTTTVVNAKSTESVLTGIVSNALLYLILVAAGVVGVTMAVKKHAADKE